MRYFIHIMIGADRLSDRTGAQYADLAAARTEAERCARELIADRLRRSGANVPDGFIEILDESGHICDLFALDAAVFGPARRFRYRQVYNTVNHNYLLLTPDLTILEANRSYLNVTRTDLASIVHRNVFDVFPDNPGDPHAAGVRKLTASLDHVLKHKEVHALSRQRYDIRERNGEWLERHWDSVNYPVLDDNGEVEFIIHQVGRVISDTDRSRADV